MPNIYLKKPKISKIYRFSWILGRHVKAFHRISTFKSSIGRKPIDSLIDLLKTFQNLQCLTFR